MGTNGNPVHPAPTTSGMSDDTKFIIASIAVTGIGVVVVGTVLGSQILHNGTRIQTLSKRISDEQHLYAKMRTEVQALRSELAAGVGPSVDEMRQVHVWMEDRMHDLEGWLSRVDHSVEELHSFDAATTYLLNQRMRDIENELEKMNRNLHNPDGADTATTHPLSEQVRAIHNALEEVHRNLRTLTFPRRAAMDLLDQRMRDIKDKLREVNRNLETQEPTAPE